MDELKKCPACGSENISILSYDVRCNGDNCGFLVEYNNEYEHAIKTWNNQPRIEQLEQELKQAKEQRDQLADLCEEIRIDLSFEMGDKVTKVTELRKKLASRYYILKGGE